MTEKSAIMAEQVAETTVSDLLAQWPETAVLFKKHNMACVGCVVAPFYSVSDAIAIYGLAREEFLNGLLKLINDQ